MKNYQEEEESKIREKRGESLITNEKTFEKVRHTKMDTKMFEDEYKQTLKEIDNRVKSRDLLISNQDEKNQKRRTRAKLLLNQYEDMLKNGFSNPARFLTKEELILIEEERLRMNLIDKEQIRSMEKSKRDQLERLQGNRTKNDYDQREIQRLEQDLLRIEEKKRELGIRN